MYIKGINIQNLDLPSGTPPTLTAYTQRRELDFYPKWTTNKKYHMIPVQSGVDATVKPDDGSAATPESAVYWTPSPSKNADLWTPFFCVRIANISEYGKDKNGMSDLNAYPKIISKSTQYFYDM